MNRWIRHLYQPSLPLGKDGKRMTACKEHIEISENAALEGMVLLKNENKLLPIKHGTKVAMFGKATFDYVKGGGGSGDVTVSYTRNLYEGLKMQEHHVNIFEDLCDYYRENVNEQYKNKKEPGLTTEPCVPSNLLSKARAFTDTAIITICRFSGEGWDRHDDFYLTKEEKEMVDTVCENFENIIVVLNVGGMVDTTWFKDNTKISSVLLMWQGGMEGGLAAAKILCGKYNPCGKLTDTFAKSFDDYPSTEGFTESEEYVKYLEDIYVGYRYFETIEGKSERVNYPFGFGLSYTDFDMVVVCASSDSQNINLTIQVTNTGNIAGKEVCQVYYNAPNGKLLTPNRQLIAFAKTRLLGAGESQLLNLSFAINDMASYDDTGKIAKSAYILEAGDYNIYVGNSVSDAKEVCFTYTLSENVIVRQLSEKLKPSRLEKRLLGNGSYEELPLSENNDKDACGLVKLPYADMAPEVRKRDRFLFFEPFAKDTILLKDVADGKNTMDEFIAQLSDEDLSYLLCGQPNTSVANTFGFGNLRDFGIPNVMTADGPAGLRIWPEIGICTTAFPCATMLACTWNTELVEMVGRAAATEVKENNIGFWLAPALNIHRNPLCGRNFEYYSEDPFISGKIGAAMVRGIQSMNIGATIKHFACNNKEVNRKESDSILSERAAREIYLKGFEIIVKEAKPYAVMTSYNVINGHRASECKELVTDILRDEWGFEGFVTTDWWTFGEQYKEILAGNDIKMGCGYPERILMALEKGLLNRSDLETSVKRLLNIIIKLD